MLNKHNQYIEYIRNKKSFLDVLADIGALFSTIFSVFSFIFNFYSRNFDNYKIVKGLLINEEINRISNKKNKKKYLKHIQIYLKTFHLIKVTQKVLLILYL